jgi:D-arabinose 1-dehydrogenase-like Zn-dependent alcohol dehydrogenase
LNCYKEDQKEETMAKMKAVVKTKPQPGAEYMDVDTPKIGPDQALVKVRATSWK